MERRLKTTAQMLAIFLNFMLTVGLETLADAAFGGFSAPIYALLIPLAAPLSFYAARRWCNNFFLFMAIHAAVIAALFYLAGFLPVPVLWRVVFTAVGIVYAVVSVRIRLTGREDGEEEMTRGFLAVAATALFFGCSYLGSDAGCARILWLVLLWVPGHWIKDYLENFLYYMKMNRKAAGAMPEQRILHGGMISVAIYSGFCLAVLTLYSKTALVARLSELVRAAGFWLLRLFLRLLLLFSGESEEEAVVSTVEDTGDPGMFLPEAEAAPVWIQILDQIVVTAVVVLLIAGLVVLAVMLIRSMIRSFYGREKEKKQIHQEGFVEEEERLEKAKNREAVRVPAIGGTPAQRVRRIFKKTVQEAWQQEGDAAEMNAKTARELAELCSMAEKKGSEWEALTALYERARYTEETVTKEDVRAAGKLSRLLHMIK